MGFGQEWKERFEKKLDAYGSKLGEIDERVAAVRTTLAEAADGSASPLPQVSDQEFYKLREAVSTGTMVLREENRELRRRQERMLSDLKDLRLEITGGRTGAQQPPAPGSPGADEPGGADDTGEAEDGTAETAAVPPSEAPGTQDSRQQEECMERERDGVPEPPGEAAPPGEAEKTLKERVRMVKKAAEQTLRDRSEDSPSRTRRTAASPAADGRRLHGVHADGGDGQRPGRQDDGRETPSDPLAEHAELLLKAAGVSRAGLVCHRDTWEFLLVQAVRHPRFRVPGEVKDTGDGKVDTHLSGPSLIAALISLWKAREKESEEVDADWAMAAMLYDRIRDRLTEAGPGDGSRTVRIVLDDGDGPEGTAAAAEPSEEEPEAA
ncbi:hypothetical protein IQ279_18940 [Streptomyces verrucosisporus]|uniref:hypothetical protein n=1 Tax=Streptomyces verrucosisporus TaxID=1695161 RepID=UPI0019D2942D|nr:hypothetical protein [Streptomyces verrucosisporus]MBN3931681.1 hypothetical protein [Streptomyces verrucosisporus]